MLADAARAADLLQPARGTFHEGGRPRCPPPRPRCPPPRPRFLLTSHLCPFSRASHQDISNSNSASTSPPGRAPSLPAGVISAIAIIAASIAPTRTLERNLLAFMPPSPRRRHARGTNPFPSPSPGGYSLFRTNNYVHIPRLTLSLFVRCSPSHLLWRQQTALNLGLPSHKGGKCKIMAATLTRSPVLIASRSTEACASSPLTHFVRYDRISGGYLLKCVTLPAPRDVRGDFLRTQVASNPLWKKVGVLTLVCMELPRRERNAHRRTS